MLRLRISSPAGEQTFDLGDEQVTIGRGRDNSIVLADPSVSRRHCEIHRQPTGWEVVDLGSTNGVLLDDTLVSRGPIEAGTRLTLGTFDVLVEDRGPTVSTVDDEAQVIVRLDNLKSVLEDKGQETQILAALVQLAEKLLRADRVEDAARAVMDAVFAAVSVDRGFLFLKQDSHLVCELARFGDQVVMAPSGVVPVSTTILNTVIEQEVALVTTDARADHRLTGGESIRLHQIRAALCVPIWSEGGVIGAVHLDSPIRSEIFGERDLEIATALASYAAMAIEGLRNVHRLEVERRSRERLARYHSPAVVDEILQGEAQRQHPLRTMETTVLFADLVGFTPVAENAGPKAVADFLGQYFDRAVEAIFEFGGTLDKFIGDSVMAFFGAPVAQPDHAARGVRAALAIQRAVAEWSVERESKGEQPIYVRVALNSGPVVVGEIGSEKRVEYTVLGNTVNVAARLEDAVAGPGEIVIGPHTKAQLPGAFLCEGLGETQLKGLSRPVRAYRVEGEFAELAEPDDA
ncbi:MAG: adenylate/guanylate cyclase domain-containing protein [Acidobacteriota bacterium]